MTKEFPEKWYMVCTKENQDVANKWRQSIATENKTEKVRIDYLFLSKHIIDGTYFFKGCLNLMKYNKNYKDYQEITFEQFKKYVLKENNMRTISAKQAQEIIDSISPHCAWKDTLFNKYGRDIFFNNPIKIDEEQYKTGFDVATSEQKQLLLAIIGEPQKEINLRTKKGIDDLILFDEDGTDNSLIAIRSYGEYKNKAFYLNEKFMWSIKKDKNNMLCLIPEYK